MYINNQCHMTKMATMPIYAEQQISWVSAYFTHILKAKTQLFSKLCVSRTLDIFLIPNCEFLPSVSFVYNQNGACIKMSSQVKPNSTIVKLCLPKPDHLGMCNKYCIPYYLYGLLVLVFICILTKTPAVCKAVCKKY